MINKTADVPRITEPNTLINFRYGRPTFDQFPIKLWRRLLSRYCCSNLTWLDYSIDPLGYKPLREAITLYLSSSRAVKCDPHQVLIVNGTQQALDLIMRLLFEPNDVIALEDPGYLSARLIFQTHGAKLLPITVDESSHYLKPHPTGEFILGYLISCTSPYILRLSKNQRNKATLFLLSFLAKLGT
ncbi:MAG: aminotransferase class I/II-fold pyridoxal phosphate-dependent enzyme [Heteroscytonema crispum UTEX LB 1556]